MANYLISRVDQGNQSYTFYPESMRVRPLLEERFILAFKSFMKAEWEKCTDLRESFSPIFCGHNIKILAPLLTRTNFFSDAELSTIYKIVSFLNNVEGDSIEDTARFKVTGLCSLTLKKPTHVADEEFVIHLKKKKFRTKQSIGNESRFFQSIYYNGGVVTFFGEKTLYREPRYSSLDVLKRLNPQMFLQTSLAYHYQSERTLVVKKTTDKWVELSSIYDISLCEFLMLDIESDILTERNRWEIAFFLALSVKELHQKDLVHRDIKPENYLVKFKKEQGKFSHRQFSLIGCDLETITTESSVQDKWVGTPQYWPQNRKKEQQKKPADIFSLGKIFCNIFRKSSLNPPIPLRLLAEKMIEEDATDRPNIDVVLAHLISNKPEESTLPEIEALCVDIGACQIL